ncbi:MAG: dihydroorotate dehydrogenase electron transfer subunit [Thermoplasmata archaeon]
MAPGLRMVKVAGQRDESRSVKTMRFHGKMDARPGQFVMVWVPGVDEFPMSVSHTGERFGITYQVLGDGTKALSKLTEGDVVGIRGPFGRGFSEAGKRLLVVAGGVGIAPTAPFVEAATMAGKEVHLVLGAKSAEELVFEERCAASGARVHVSTDDGSKGYAGFATGLASSLLEKDAFDSVYACGPERMITTMVGICRERGLPMQASVERIMKCGIGVCDSCALDGRHVCTDGPVFGIDELARFKELGKTRLDRTGRKTGV